MNLLPSKFDMLKFLKKISLFKVAYIILAIFALASLISSVSSFLLMNSKRIETTSRSVQQANTKFISITDQNLQKQNYTQIKNRNLFNAEGTVPEENTEPSKPVITSEAVKTRLPLRIKGILYTSDPKSGLISLTLTTKNLTKNYSVGSSLFKQALPSVILSEIYPKKIIFFNKGQKEYLELDPTTKKPESSFTRKVKKKPSLSNDNYEEDGFKREGQSITVTEEYRQKLLTTEFAKILRDVRALPYKDASNTIIGYRLSQLKQGSIFDKVGLKDNDIVTEINGVQLGNASQAIRYLQSLRNKNEVQMEVMRNGKKQEFNLQVQ